MTIAMNATKLVVRDVGAAEGFYTAIGLKIVSRNVGGEAEVRQRQSLLSATGDAHAHVLVLSQFLELPPPRAPVYPGEVWLTFHVADVDATCATVRTAGGRIVRAGQDRPEHRIRAAVVADPEGHLIELIGPISAG